MKKLLLFVISVLFLFVSCNDRNYNTTNGSLREILQEHDSMLLAKQAEMFDTILDNKIAEVRDKLIKGTFLREGLLPKEAAAIDPSQYPNASKEISFCLNANTSVFLEEDLRSIVDAISEDVLEENFDYVTKSGHYKLMGGAMNFDAGQFVIIEYKESLHATDIEVFRADLYYGDDLFPGECFVSISGYNTDPNVPAKKNG